MKGIGILFIVIGVLGIIVSFGVDFIGLGKDGVQAFQVMGILASVFLAALGWGVFLENRDARSGQLFSFRSVVPFWRQVPVVAWFFSGFLLVYFFLFVTPVFLNENLRLHYFINYIPEKYPIGVDIGVLTKYAYNWYTVGENPYLDGTIPSPPFYVLFMAPFVLLDYPKIYYLSLLINFLAFFCIPLSYIFAVFRVTRLDYALIIFFLGTGLFSYGMLFELERGQLNLFVISLAILAIVLFHYRPSFRLLSYLLFSVAIQIKVYPVFLVLLFVDDWRAWKQNIKRFFGLGLLNIAALFILGYQEFIYFLASILNRFGSPFWWVGNHSIYNFARNLTNDGFGIIPPDEVSKLSSYASILELVLIVYVLVCILLVILMDYKEHRTGLNKYLLVVTIIATMLIPAESQDYKLAFIPPVLAIFFSDQSLFDEVRQRFLYILGVGVISVSYSIMLFPFKYRPEHLGLVTPMLLIILTIVMMLALIRKNKSQAIL